jgi:hypothetical protein
MIHIDKAIFQFPHRVISQQNFVPSQKFQQLQMKVKFVQPQKSASLFFAQSDAIKSTRYKIFLQKAQQ